MTRLLALLLLPLLPPAAQAKEPLARIETGCVAKLREENNRRAPEVCACVRAAYAGKHDFVATDLELMARSYEDDSAAEQELQKDKYEDLILFDFQIAEGCLENPARRRPASRKP